MAKFALDELGLKEWVLTRWGQRRVTTTPLTPESVLVSDLTFRPEHWVDDTIALLTDEKILTCDGPWGITVYPIDDLPKATILVTVWPYGVPSYDFFQIAGFAYTLAGERNALGVIREVVGSANRFLAHAELFAETVGLDPHEVEYQEPIGGT